MKVQVMSDLLSGSIIRTLINVVMVTTEESTSVMDAVQSSSKTCRYSKLTSAKKTVDPGMLLPYVEYR